MVESRLNLLQACARNGGLPGYLPPGNAGALDLDRYAAIGNHGRFIQLSFVKKIDGRDWQIDLRVWRMGEQDYWTIITAFPPHLAMRADLDRAAEIVLKTVRER